MLSVALPIRGRDGCTRVATSIDGATSGVQWLLFPVNDGLPNESCLVASVSELLNYVGTDVRGK